MPKLLRWLRNAVVGLVGLLVLLLLVVYFLSGRKLNRTYTFAMGPLSVAIADADIENGRRLAQLRGCFGCHGDDLSGEVMVENFMFGKLSSANLTSGRGGVGAEYLDVDWVRGIRHGVDRDGKPLIIMPSNDFAHMSDQDLADIIAYVKSVPPVDNELPDQSLGPMARWIITSGAYSLPASLIDHSAQAAAPEPGITVAYGEYLARFCMGCHGEDLGGGESNPGPNLTRGGRLADWTQEDFVQTLRSGVRPDGSELSAGMPWQATKAMNDDEMAALWMYLRSLPAVSDPPTE